MTVGVVCVLKALSAALVEVRTELIEVTQRAVEEKGGKKKEGEEEEEEGQRRMLEEKAEELQVRTYWVMHTCVCTYTYDCSACYWQRIL